MGGSTKTAKKCKADYEKPHLWKRDKSIWDQAVPVNVISVIKVMFKQSNYIVIMM